MVLTEVPSAFPLPPVVSLPGVGRAKITEGFELFAPCGGSQSWVNRIFDLGWIEQMEADS